MFGPTEDPGPSFAMLLDRIGHTPPIPEPALDSKLEIAHGTTIVAIRYCDGVIMAGDRRATEGHAIAHRKIEKVFPADNFSGVSIAGAAGPAIELVKLFQTQLEHYEKVEGQALTLEGKANQLGTMVRSNLPMAMQGLVVIPLFAGFDHSRRQGRIFTYDVTGGRYEETDHHATGSGGRDARTTIKLGFTEGMGRVEAVRLALTALYEAADEDSATGGPDMVRGIYPTVATITADGFTRVEEEEIVAIFVESVAGRTAVATSARKIRESVLPINTVPKKKAGKPPAKRVPASSKSTGTKGNPKGSSSK